MEEDKIWYIDNTLSKLQPRDALNRILAADLANYNKAQTDLQMKFSYLIMR